MASGKEHLKIWGTATAFLAAPGSIAFIAIPTVFSTAPYWEPYHILHFGMGWLVAPVINPDKDVDGTTFEEAWLIKVVPPMGFLWQIIWYPYALGIKHRDNKSHGVVTGTVLRALYMLGVVICIIWSWAGLAHLLVALDDIVSTLPGLPQGVIATPGLWLWPWPLEVTTKLLVWLASRPFEVMWYLIGQECATIISHLIPDKYDSFRVKTVFGE